jgi:hypothetical protein
MGGGIGGGDFPVALELIDGGIDGGIGGGGGRGDGRGIFGVRFGGGWVGGWGGGWDRQLITELLAGGGEVQQNLAEGIGGGAGLFQAGFEGGGGAGSGVAGGWERRFFMVVHDEGGGSGMRFKRTGWRAVTVRERREDPRARWSEGGATHDRSHNAFSVEGDSDP